jgi:hypothetical protein
VVVVGAASGIGATHSSHVLDAILTPLGVQCFCGPGDNAQRVCIAVSQPGLLTKLCERSLSYFSMIPFGEARHIAALHVPRHAKHD